MKPELASIDSGIARQGARWYVRCSYTLLEPHGKYSVIKRRYKYAEEYRWLKRSARKRQTEMADACLEAVKADERIHVYEGE